jgi:hypothetical protein
MATLTIEAPARAGVQRRVRSGFYVGLSGLMVAMMVVGFWPSYFGPMLRGDVARPAIIQAHGAIFVGWMALLMAQVAFAARGRIDLHKRIGRYGIGYGWAVLVIGVVVGPAASVLHIQAGEWTRARGAGFLLTTAHPLDLSRRHAAAVRRGHAHSVRGVRDLASHRPAHHRRLAIRSRSRRWGCASAGRTCPKPRVSVSAPGF